MDTSTNSVCNDCKYYNTCGEPDRTQACNGKEHEPVKITDACEFIKTIRMPSDKFNILVHNLTRQSDAVIIEFLSNHFGVNATSYHHDSDNMDGYTYICYDDKV